jgi:hypothetical protein
MQSYLEACGVPTAKVGNVEVPRLIMGIHPYDGCSYQDKKRDAENFDAFSRVENVANVIKVAVDEAGITAVQVDHMVANLDRLHMQAVWEAEQQLQKKIAMVAYILVPIVLDGEIVSYSPKAHATFYQNNERLGGEKFRDKIRQDEIVRYVMGGSSADLITPEKAAPFTEAEAAKLTIDYGILERHLGFFEGCDILIADPGAEIDLLAMTGRFDLIREYIAFLRERYDTVITSVHHAGVTIPILERENISVDGYLTTVNKPGTFMFPTQEIALDAIANAKKPVMSIKPMAGGRFLGPQAFDFVFNKVGVAATMFGMGTMDQVRETTAAARQVLAA